jgi:hypothetical protein
MSDYDNNNKGALWLKTAKTGRKYMGGEIVINNKKHYIKVFKNENKNNERQPDYNLIVDQPQQYINPQAVPTQMQQNAAQQNTQNVQAAFQGEPASVVADPWENDQNIEF